jgi:hypothetical protein
MTPSRVKPVPESFEVADAVRCLRDAGVLDDFENLWPR